MPVPVDELPAPSPWSRVALTFTAPSRAFTGPGLAGSWWAPYLVLVVVSLAMMFTVGKTVGWETVARNTIASSPAQQARLAQAPADQQAAQTAMVGGILHTTAFITPFLAPLFLGTVIAAVLLATFNFGMGAKSRFGALFAVYMFSALPQLIKSLLVILLLALHAGRDTFLLNNPVGSNPAFYLQGSGAGHATLSLLTWLDVFLLWQIVLLILGGAVVAKVSRGKAAAAVLGWVVFFMLVTTGLAAL